MAEVIPTSSSWIAEGQKFALMGLCIKLEKPIGFQELARNVWVFDNVGFKMPQQWLQWLGSLRVQEIEQSTFFLMSKLDSKRPNVFDEEDQKLGDRVLRAYTGLMLSSRFGDAYKPTMISGACLNGEISVRQHQNFDPSIRSNFRFYIPVTDEELKQAGDLGANIDAIHKASISGGHWRLFRILSLYTWARTLHEQVDRVHQFCRCIEGLLVPKPGNSKKYFKSRTELFIGASHHEFMGAAYDMRGAVEHLHEDKYLHPPDRPKRLDILEKEAVTEYIARMVLRRIVSNPILWEHFANTTALEAFWRLNEAERRKLWGDSFDPMDSLKEYDPKSIQNSQLGM